MWAAAAVLFGSPPARAVDAYEIQVYDGTANAPGQAGIELHINSVASGRRTAVAPELPPHHQSHLTAEPSLGLTRWWELGAYLQAAVRASGEPDFVGVKLRSKFVWPAARPGPFRWGVNLEVGELSPRDDPHRWGAEVRPIAAYTTPQGRFAFAFTPILDFSLAGPDAEQFPSFEPALSALFVVDGLVSAGLEYYGELGPLGHPLPRAEQQHSVFQVVNVLRWRRIELNLGVGEGLTAASNRFVAKMILGFL